MLILILVAAFLSSTSIRSGQTYISVQPTKWSHFKFQVVFFRKQQRVNLYLDIRFHAISSFRFTFFFRDHHCENSVRKLCKQVLQPNNIPVEDISDMIWCSMVSFLTCHTTWLVSWNGYINRYRFNSNIINIWAWLLN